MEREVLNRNGIRVVGELVETNLEVRESQKGQDYISGTFTVKSVLEGREQLTELRLFSFKFKKDGGENKLFKTYANLDDMLNTRIAVSGEVGENRFFNEKDNQVVSYGQNMGRFINKARKTDEDCATFEFAGYVIKPLSEKLNKEEEVVHYELTMAQADYTGTKPTIIKFVIDKDNKPAARAIDSMYDKGATASISGDISIVIEEVKVEEEAAFGDPKVKVYTNTYRSYVITSGTEPVEGKGHYDAEYIQELADAYEEAGVSIQTAAKERATQGKSTPNSDGPATSKKDGLSSLL